MAVAVDEVLAIWRDTERQLRVIPKDDPGRHALEESISDLGLLYKWLTCEATAQSAARLTASRSTIDAARQLLRSIDERRSTRVPDAASETVG